MSANMPLKLTMLCGLVSSSAAAARGAWQPTASRENSAAPVSTMTAQRFEGQPLSLPDPGDPGSIGLPVDRGEGGPWYYGRYRYYCGNFATGDPEELGKAWKTLHDEEWNALFPMEPGRCNRAFCWDTSAIWVCNDLAEDDTTTYAVDGFHIGYMANRILQLCCNEESGQSGQMFHFNERWNVVVGYANCNDPSSKGPEYGGNGLGNNLCCVNKCIHKGGCDCPQRGFEKGLSAA